MGCGCVYNTFPLPRSSLLTAKYAPLPTTPVLSPRKAVPTSVFPSATGSHSRWHVRESRISREETQSDIVQSEWSTESANAPSLFLLTIGYGTVVPTHSTSRRKGSTETEEKMSQNAKVEVRPRQFDEKFRRASGDPSGVRSS